MAPCHVTLSRVVDFRAGFDPGDWGPLWQELSCNWRGSALSERSEPPSWLLGDEVLQAGASGVLYPSLRHAGGIDLVVYTNAIRGALGGRFAVHDPDRKPPGIRTAGPHRAAALRSPR
jgi:hypothetical protein